MMRRLIVIASAAALVCALAPVAGAQVAPAPFAIRTQQGTTVQNIADGGTLALPADGIGLAADGILTISYTGTGSTASATNPCNSLALAAATCRSRTRPIRRGPTHSTAATSSVLAPGWRPRLPASGTPH